MRRSAEVQVAKALRAMVAKSRPGAVTALLAMALIAPAGGVASASAPSEAVAAVAANPVVVWNANAADAARTACLAPLNNPLHESRMYAIMHLAIHDALNAIKPRSRPYAYHGSAPGASAPAAVAAAARTALVGALADVTGPFTPCIPAAIDGVEVDYTESLSSIPDGSAKLKGIAVGKKAAYTLLAARADDGSDTLLIDTGFPEGTKPGQFRYISVTDKFAFAPRWGEVTPFVRRSTRIRVAPPYPLHSKRYARDFREVKRLGGDGTSTPSARTAEQTEVALFWNENSPPTWNRIARQLATDNDLNLWQSARMFGLLNMALADGYVASLKVKYDHLFWRPVTAIRLAATDRNPRTTADPAWLPLRPTPPVPEHNSAHSVEGGAAAAALKGFFGTDRLRFSVCSYTLPAGSTCTDAKPVMRTYTSLSQAAAENARSRVLIGYHFNHATTVGNKHGYKIGKRTVRHYLQPRLAN